MKYIIENNTYIDDERDTECDSCYSRSDAIGRISRIIEGFIAVHKTDFDISVQPPDGISPGSMVLTDGYMTQLVVAKN